MEGDEEAQRIARAEEERTEAIRHFSESLDGISKALGSFEERLATFASHAEVTSKVEEIEQSRRKGVRRIMYGIALIVVILVPLAVGLVFGFRSLRILETSTGPKALAAQQEAIFCIKEDIRIDRLRDQYAFQVAIEDDVSKGFGLPIIQHPPFVEPKRHPQCALLAQQQQDQEDKIAKDLQKAASNNGG